ncbi:MAG: NAD-dependent epimerase/dehydratase family protein, partial [Polyangiales bacterium]
MSGHVRYLVTGGGGFIGSSIAEALLARGDRVRVLDDFSTGRRSNLEKLDVELVEGDLCDADTLARAMKGIEVVFHEAARASVPRSIAHPLAANMVNAHGTLMVLEAARAAGVRRVIYAGTSSAYGDTPTLPKREDMTPMPLSPYAVSKLAGEQYVAVYSRLHGLDGLTTRYFNVFGPRQDPNGAYAAVIPRWIASALAGEPLQVHGDGAQTRDFSYIDNVVHANLLAADCPKPLGGAVVNIACNDRISLLQLAESISAEVGRKVQLVHGPSRPGDVKDSLA